jgi:hypothetical protein
VLTANPALTAAEVRRIIAETARTVPGQTLRPDRFFGHGCVDAAAAVQMALAMRGAVAAPAGAA